MKKIIICLLSLMFFQNTYSKVEIKNVFFDLDKSGHFNLNLISDGKLIAKPDITTRENIIQVELNDSFVWPKINKNVKQKGKKISIVAYQFDKKRVRVRVIFPKGEKISVKNVKSGLNQRGLSYSGSVSNGKPSSLNAANYDESYLNKLLKEKEVIQDKVLGDESYQKVKNDSVSLRYSSPNKEEKKNRFNIWKYGLKFFGFLTLIIGFIYSAFFFLKKGALKKNKLKFLSSDNQIEVISKTFMSPKRSLLLIRVKQQVFLVANHENGVEFISEVKESAKVLRDAELEVTGENFDKNLGQLEKKVDVNFKLKEDINISSSQDNEEDSLANKVKNKIRAFKDIQ